MEKFEFIKGSAESPFKKFERLHTGACTILGVSVIQLGIQTELAPG